MGPLGSEAFHSAFCIVMIFFFGKFIRLQTDIIDDAIFSQKHAGDLCLQRF